MNWNNLALFISGLSEEQRETTVTVLKDGEYYPVAFPQVEEDSDILDVDHPIIVIE